ncbi:HbrB-like-domain-containing protein [Syncephalis plumigaleata]|nr:HbrB-like-domain-containing protein [Syncephalis plumigaleata]
MDIFDIVAASARVKPPASSSAISQSTTAGDGYLMRGRTGSSGEASLAQSLRPGKPSRLLMSPITQRAKMTLKSPRSQKKSPSYQSPASAGLSPDEYVNYSMHTLSPDIPMLTSGMRKGKPRAGTTSSVERDALTPSNTRAHPLYGKADRDQYTLMRVASAGGNGAIPMVLPTPCSNINAINTLGIPVNGYPESTGKDAFLSNNASSNSLKSLSSLDARGVVLDVTQATDAAMIDDWTRIGMTVLPLFNGEAVHGCMEDLAALVKQCIYERDRSTLLVDFTRILNHGMLNLNAQLQHLPSEDALLPWLADTWHFFHTDVLAYLLCVFMPLQSLLNRRVPESFNLREQILTSFRDQVFLPISEQIIAQFTKIPATADGETRETMARIVQMTGIICNISANPEQRRRAVHVWHALMRRWHVIMSQQRDLRRPNATYRRWTRSTTGPIPPAGRRLG